MRKKINGVIVKRLLAACICAALVFTSAACRDKEAKSGREIYIPILADNAWLTADGAFINGAALAAEDLNAEYSSKGFAVKTAVIDDKAQYETGVEVATKVAQESNITAVFNLQNFDVSKTTAGILSSSGKLTMFPYGAYDSLFTKNNPYLFCGVSSFSDLGRAMAGYAVKKGYKRAVIYHNGKQSQEELVEAFELALMNTSTKVVDYVPSIASGTEFDSIYSRWQALDADCMVISQYGLDRAFEILKLLRDKDKKIPVIAEPIFNRANALADNKAASEGMVVPSTMVVEESEKLKSFNSKYRQKYGKDADIWAVQGYDMVRLVVDTAVRLDTNNPVEIAKAMHSEQGYDGVQGHISFNAGGALKTDIKKLDMLSCKDGNFMKIER